MFILLSEFQVLYPTVEDQKGNQRTIQIDPIVDSVIGYTANFDIIFVSLNRFERKKNIALAIDAFDNLRTQSKSLTQSQAEILFDDGISAVKVKSIMKRVMLVIAGGYDSAVVENVDYLAELKAYTSSVGLKYSCSQDNIQIGDSQEYNGNSDFHIVFRTSISGLERESLLHRAEALLYTPDR